jgi:hypothetical protein
MIESNEGKPKIQRKGKGSKGRGRVTVCPTKARALLNSKDRDFDKFER